jgi:hypothetical protein
MFGVHLCVFGSAAAKVDVLGFRVTVQVSILRALGERLLSSIHTFFALRDYFPVLSFVVLPRTLAGFRLFR